MLQLSLLHCGSYSWGCIFGLSVLLKPLVQADVKNCLDSNVATYGGVVATAVTQHAVDDNAIAAFLCLIVYTHLVLQWTPLNAAASPKSSSVQGSGVALHCAALLLSTSASTSPLKNVVAFIFLNGKIYLVSTLRSLVFPLVLAVSLHVEVVVVVDIDTRHVGAQDVPQPFGDSRVQPADVDCVKDVGPSLVNAVDGSSCHKKAHNGHKAESMR